MKILVRLSTWALLALLAGPRISSAQTPAPPADPAAPAADTPAPTPAPDAQPPPPQTPPVSPDLTAPPPSAPAVGATPTPPASSPLAHGVEWTSLRLLRAKGVITDAEYNAALKDMGEIASAPDATTLVVAKMKVTLFGFAQADFTLNSTQSCQEYCSNAIIQRAGSYRGDNARMNFSPRDSRIGIRFAAPEERSIRASGLLELDFFGPTTTTEQGTWANPVLRIRHAYFRLETPVVDFLVGQSGNLFGWASNYLVTGAQEPGLPGQMYQRTSQLRISKTIRTSPAILEIAAAANRPVQMDSAIPELVAGVRLQLNALTGYHTLYLSTSLAQPASIAITGDLRNFKIPEFSTAPHAFHKLTGGGVSVDAFLPIVPATKASHDNALALTGEFVYGKGTSDMYTALGAAGTVTPAIPPAMAGGTPGVYTPNFDAGFAQFDATGHVELLQWTSYMVGAEFYPGGLDGRLGLFASYGHQQSNNTAHFSTTVARKSEDFFGAGFFFDPTKQTRFGLDFGYYGDHSVDNTTSTNYSGLFSTWLFF